MSSLKNPMLQLRIPLSPVAEKAGKKGIRIK
jgi:hypothetical protein